MRRSSSSPRPRVGAYAAQCWKCLKWRYIPSKEQYEIIRHYASVDHWVCNKASAWRPNASCDDPPELSQDNNNNYLWIIDKPDIPRPPTGWERLVSIRGEGASRFADVYYIAPSGKKLRSMVEVQSIWKTILSTPGPGLTFHGSIIRFLCHFMKGMSENEGPQQQQTEVAGMLKPKSLPIRENSSPPSTY